MSYIEILLYPEKSLLILSKSGDIILNTFISPIPTLNRVDFIRPLWQIRLGMGLNPSP